MNEHVHEHVYQFLNGFFSVRAFLLCNFYVLFFIHTIPKWILNIIYQYIINFLVTNFINTSHLFVIDDNLLFVLSLYTFYILAGGRFRLIIFIVTIFTDIILSLVNIHTLHNHIETFLLLAVYVFHHSIFSGDSKMDF